MRLVAKTRHWIGMKLTTAWPQKLGVIVFLLALGVYLLTLAPSITWQHGGNDAGDLITAVHNLGIPHPTGYPVYVLLGKLFTLLPWGDIAHRLNLMSAFFAAGAVAVVYLTILSIIRGIKSASRPQLPRVVAAVVGAFMLAFSPAFWSQAIITEVYSLNAFFLSVVSFLLVRVARSDERSTALSSPRVGLWFLAVTCGLSLGNHLLMLLFLPSVVTFLILRCRRLFSARDVVIALLLFALGLGTYLYLPIRAGKNPMVNWGNPSDLKGFLWVVTAAPYHGMLFALPLPQVIDRLAFWLCLIPQQFTCVGLLLLLIGLSHSWETNAPLAVASSIGVATNVIYTTNYAAADVQAYFIVSYLLMAIWLSIGLSYLLGLLQHQMIMERVSDGSQRILTSVVPILFLLLPILTLGHNFRALNLSSEHEAFDYASEILETVDREAIIISDDDRYTFTLWYFIYVLGKRPDVTVLDARLLRWAWYRQNLDAFYPDVNAEALDPKLRWSVGTLLGEMEHGRRLYLTYEILLPSGYILVPHGTLFAVRKEM